MPAPTGSSVPAPLPCQGQQKQHAIHAEGHSGRGGDSAPKFAYAEQIQGNESACSFLCLNLDEQGEGQDRDDEGKTGDGG
jgi:hypothetical protein